MFADDETYENTGYLKGGYTDKMIDEDAAFKKEFDKNVKKGTVSGAWYHIDEEADKKENEITDTKEEAEELVKVDL